MLFSLDVVRARKGDCLILHFGSKDDPRIIMIDGGPSGVYGPHLKPRLEQIRTARGLGKKEPLQVDALMVSHVDDDHIRGILDMTRELINNPTSQLVQLLGVWHNSFENIIGSDPKELTAAVSKKVPTASATSGELPSDVTIEARDEDLDETTIVANLKVLASIQQGAQLRSDVVDGLNVDLNPDFDGKLALAAEDGEPIDMGEGLQFTVVGPMLPELKELHKKHQAWLKELAEKGLSAEDALAAYVDKSVANLSSIVVLAEADGKRMLLTGDARGDRILEGLELVGLMEKGGKIHVDILKVPHHGSSNNLDDDFFERITADHYVFSGDGEHGNPERESLEMLLKARGNDDYTVHLTYPVDEIDAGRKLDWEKEQTKQKNKKKKNPKVEVREDWSPDEHSLGALFAKHKAFGKKVKIVEEGQAHLINLLDEVGF
jgi:hypothetical protein